MNKLMLFTTAVYVALGVSCGSDPSPEPEFVEVWRSTQHYFNVEVLAVFPPFMEVEVKQQIEQESTVSVSEDENYRMNLREDGSGTGSVFWWREQRRASFNFTWQLADSTLTLTGDGALLTHQYFTFYDKLVWKIEERTADRMVLSTDEIAHSDGIDGSAWNEQATIRYTFERVK